MSGTFLCEAPAGRVPRKKVPDTCLPPDPSVPDLSNVNNQSTDRGPWRFDSVFAHALAVVLAAWIVGAALLMATQAWYAPQHFAAVGMVTAFSGLVAVVALLPGLLVAGWSTASPRGRAENDYSTPLMASVILRLVGTVALFLLCRYQMAAADELIAAVVVGWYVFLTIVEVTALARRLPQFGEGLNRGPLGGVASNHRDLGRSEISVGSTV